MILGPVAQARSETRDLLQSITLSKSQRIMHATTEISLLKPQVVTVALTIDEDDFKQANSQQTLAADLSDTRSTS